MNLNLERFQKFVLFLLLFTLIPLWNIPHTIAARYSAEALLLAIIFVSKPNWPLFFQTNKVLLLFFVYLLIQLLFFSNNYSLAFSNFRAEWMHFILFSLIGAGAGLILGKGAPKKILLYLGIAFSIPLYIHLALSLVKGISTGGIPWGYWGINEIHGDFGYPAMQASILLLSYYLYQAKSKATKLSTLGLIIVCIASPLLAGSRGGTGFTIAAIVLTLMLYPLLSCPIKADPKRNLVQLLLVIALIITTFQIGLMKDPGRWGGIFSRLSTGLQGDPTTVYCKGIQHLENELISKGIAITPEIQKGLQSVVDGDGSRMMAARSGYELAVRHPMGIDQSKQAYQIAIAEICDGPPNIFIAHAHNSWIDTALAIGIPGAALLLIVMLQYAKLGWVTAKLGNLSSPYGIALFTSASMWIFRGLLDSTMRDQMLEMQAFIFALLLGLILAQNKMGINK